MVIVVAAAAVECNVAAERAEQLPEQDAVGAVGDKIAVQFEQSQGRPAEIECTAACTAAAEDTAAAANTAAVVGAGAAAAAAEK